MIDDPDLDRAIDEIERLKAEIERLQNDNAHLTASVQHYVYSDLTDEIERLRAALTAIQQDADDGALDSIVIIARAALNPKE